MSVFGSEVIKNARIEDDDNPLGFCIIQARVCDEVFLKLSPDLAQEHEKKWKPFRTEEKGMHRDQKV